MEITLNCHHDTNERYRFSKKENWFGFWYSCKAENYIELYPRMTMMCYQHFVEVLKDRNPEGVSHVEIVTKPGTRFLDPLCSTTDSASVGIKWHEYYAKKEVSP